VFDIDHSTLFDTGGNLARAARRGPPRAAMARLRAARAALVAALAAAALGGAPHGSSSAAQRGFGVLAAASVAPPHATVAAPPYHAGPAVDDVYMQVIVTGLPDPYTPATAALIQSAVEGAAQAQAPPGVSVTTHLTSTAHAAYGAVILQGAQRA
jgi:hypothetical protein